MHATVGQPTQSGELALGGLHRATFIHNMFDVWVGELLYQDLMRQTDTCMMSMHIGLLVAALGGSVRLLDARTSEASPATHVLVLYMLGGAGRMFLPLPAPNCKRPATCSTSGTTWNAKCCRTDGGEAGGGPGENSGNNSGDCKARHRSQWTKNGDPNPRQTPGNGA